MPNSIQIQPIGPLRATVRPPGSKSITNRALVCAALAEGQSLLTGALESDDTGVMIEGLGQMGIDVRHDRAARTIHVTGCGGCPPADSADMFLGNSGTTVRFLTAVATLGCGVYRLDGVPRMRQRPIQDLLDALRQLGADAVSESGSGCPPVVVRGTGLPGGRAEVAGDISSQFLPHRRWRPLAAHGEIELVVRGELVSKPYVAMTLAVMRAFGAAIAGDGFPLRVAAPQRYRGRTYAIEPDASAASYFFAAAAITGGSVTVEGLSRNSLQGDVAFCDCLRAMGCGVSEAAEDHGDRRRVARDRRRHERHQRHRTDAGRRGPVSRPARRRSATSRTSATRRPTASRRWPPSCGSSAPRSKSVTTGLTITPRPLHGATIDTYDDHRMAMSMALVGLSVPGVVIRDPGCVAKTYPEFFADLAGLALELRH